MNEKQKSETSYTAELRNDAQFFYLLYKSTMTMSYNYLSVKHIFSITSLCCTLDHLVDFVKQRAFCFCSYTVDICTL